MGGAREGEVGDGLTSSLRLSGLPWRRLSQDGIVGMARMAWAHTQLDNVVRVCGRARERSSKGWQCCCWRVSVVAG